MTNRTDARLQLRTQLTDPATGGLFTDAELNTALAQAHSRVAPRYLLPATHAVPMTVADQLLTISGGAADRVRHYVAVTSPQGGSLPRLFELPTGSATFYALAWHTITGAARLTRYPSTNEVGTYSVMTRDIAADVTDDATAYALPIEVIPALIDYAAAFAIRARLVDDVRRSRMVDHSARILASQFEASAEQLMTSTRRVARGGTL